MPSCDPPRDARARPASRRAGMTVSTCTRARPLRIEVVRTEEVVARAHRRAVDRQLLPPEPMERSRRVRAARRTADGHTAGRRDRGERPGPGRLADRLDDDVGSATGRLLHGLDDVAGVVVHRDVGAPGERLRELLVAAGGDDRARAERPADLERSGRDPAADAPDQHPLARLHGRLGDEHPVGGLVDERKRRRLLERQRVVEREHLRRVDRDQLAVRAVGMLAEHRDQVPVLEAGVEHDPVADGEAVDSRSERLDDPGAVRSQDPGLRHGREAHAHPHIEVVERRGCEADENLAVGRFRIGNVLVPQDLRPAVLVDSDRLHGQNPLMTAAELARAAEELGIDVIGAAPAEAYDETEQHIIDRRDRGLFAGMKFTMARPEVSCHPELLLDGEARTVVSAALCYWADAPDPAPGEGRLPRYAWIDHYALLRERLDALGRQLGGRYRVLVDENQHVDREGARRAGVGFYGKNTMMITREHGSWVVLGTLVTDAEIESTRAARPRLRPLPPLHRRLPDRRARRARRARREPLPLVLDAGPGSRAGALPGGAGRVGLRLRHLPGRLPLEPRHREAARRPAAPGRCDPERLAPRLAHARRRGADRRGRPPLRSAQRPALAAPERAHRARQRGRRGRPARSPRHGSGATTRCSPRPRPGRSSGSRSGPDERRRPSGLAVVVHEIRSPVAALVAIAAAYPDADEATAAATPRACRGSARRASSGSSSRRRRAPSAPSGSMPAASRAMPPRRRRSRSGSGVVARDGGRSRCRRATPSGCDRRSTT